jgi:hypothetical protein
MATKRKSVESAAARIMTPTGVASRLMIQRENQCTMIQTYKSKLEATRSGCDALANPFATERRRTDCSRKPMD